MWKRKWGDGEVWRRSVWTDGVRNEEVLLRVRYKKTLLTVKRRKGSWIGHILLRNCLLILFKERKKEEWK